MYMLIDFDQKSGKLISCRTFGESEGDLVRKARLDLELSLHAAGEVREIVILRAIDEEQIRRTHRRYFETSDDLWAPDIRKHYQPELKKIESASA